MSGINQVVFQGNLTRDPELRVTPGGKSVCQYSVANNESWKDASGQQQSKVTFLEVVSWGKTGEIIAKFFSKGDQIIVHGKLVFEQWEDKTSGKKQSKLKLDASYPTGGFSFCGKTTRSSGGESQQQDSGESFDQSQPAPPQNQQRQNNAPPPRRPTPPQYDPTNLDEDVPF